MVRVRLGRDAKRGRYIGLGWAGGFSTVIDNTGTPLIGRFLGPRKNRLNRNPSY